VRDRSGELAECGHSRDVGKFALRLLQRLLGALGGGDVHQRPYIFEMAGFVIDWMGYDVNMLDSPVGQQQPVFDFPVLPLLRYARDEAFDHRAIFGVRAVQHYRDCGLCSSIVVEDAERLVRPLDVSTNDVPGETSGAAQSLGLGKISLAPPQGVRSAFAIFDIGIGSIPFDDITVLVAERRVPIEEPTIFSGGRSNARFRFKRSTRGHIRASRLQEFRQVLGMVCCLPADALPRSSRCRDHRLATIKLLPSHLR
jgi:hypothetical protein